MGVGPLVRRRGKNESFALRRKNADVAEQNNGGNGTALLTKMQDRRMKKIIERYTQR